MADEKDTIEKDSILGVTVTIKGDEIKKGADLFVQQIDRMEKASDKAAVTMNKSFDSLNLRLIKVNEQLNLAEQRLKNMAGLIRMTTGGNSQVSELRQQVEQLSNERDYLQQQINAANNKGASASSSLASGRAAAANAQVKEAKANVKSLEQEIKRLNKEYDAYDDKIDSLKSKAQSAPDATKRHEYERQIKEVEKKKETTRRQLTELLPEYNDATKQLDAMTKAMEASANSHESLRKRIRRLKEEMAGLDKASPEYAEKAKEARELQAQMASINDEASRQSTELTRVVGGARNFGTMMEMLPEPIRNVVSQFNQFIKAGIKFVATPIGAVVTALVLAYKALSSWSTNTADGQKAMAKVTGYAEGIFRKLTQSVYDFIRSIKGIDEAVPELDKEDKKGSSDSDYTSNMSFRQRWRAGKDKLTEANKIQKEVQRLQYDLNLAADPRMKDTKFSDGFNSYSQEEYVKHLQQQIDDLIAKEREARREMKEYWYLGWMNSMEDYTIELSDAAQQMSAIKLEALEIERSIKAWAVTEAEINNQLARQQSLLSSPTATTRQKYGATSEIGTLTKQLNDKRLEFAKSKFSNAKRIADGGDISDADINSLTNGNMTWEAFGIKYSLNTNEIDTIINAYSEVISAETRLMSDRENNAQQLQTLHTQILTEEREYAESLLEIQQEMAEKEADILESKEDLALSILADSIDKRMALREQERRKALRQLEQQRDDAVESARQAARQEYGMETSLTGRAINALVYADNLTPEQEQSLSGAERNIRSRFLERVRLANVIYDVGVQQANANYNDVNDLLTQYQDYTAKKLALDIQYGEDRERIMKAIAQQEAVVLDETLTDDEKRNAENLLPRLRALLNERKNQYDKDTKSLNEQTASQQAQEKIDEAKKSPAYMMAMQDVRKVSTTALNSLLAQLRLVSAEVAKLDPEKAQAIANLMESINNELINRNPFQSLKTYANNINDLQTERDNLKDTIKNGGGIFNGEIVTKEEAEKRLIEVEGQLYTAHQNYQTALVKATDQLQTIFSQLGNIGSKIGGRFGTALNGVASLGSTMLNYRTTFSEASMKANGLMNENGKMTGMGKAQTYLAAASAAYEAGSLVASLIPRNGKQKRYEKYARRQAEINQLTQSVMSYQLAILRASQAEEQWFGSDAVGNLKSSWEVASKAKDQYFAKLREQQETYQNKDKDDNWSGVVASGIVGAISGAMIGGSMGSSFSPYGTIIGAAIGAAVGTAAGIATNNLVTDYDSTKSSAMDNLRIETKKRKKSFLGIGGHDQQTADLRTWAKDKYGADLFDEEGWINTELAQQILENYSDKLQGQTQETIEQLIELKEQYDEYKQTLRDYVSSLYEPLVDNMVDSLWQWFDNGKDALSAFRDSASQTFRDIVTDMMRTIVLSKVFDGFQDNIEDLYDQYAKNMLTEQDLMNAVAKETNDLMSRYENQLPVLQETMNTIVDSMRQNGIDIASAGSYSSSGSTAFSSMSQDVGNEMNGRLTAIQMQGESIIAHLMAQSVSMHTLTINSTVTMGYISEIRDIQLASQDHLRKIQANTNELYQINKRLESIDNNTKKL